MKSAAEQFLERKRQQQAFTKRIPMPKAPSAARRYGMDSMGGYQLQAGKYTGAGPNGVVEPMRPTERRIAVNGKPYAVDEGELLVNNAKTVQAYGGPEKLDRFIQENAPSGAMRNGMESNMQTEKKDMMKNLNQPLPQMSCGGIPRKRYYTGGVVTDESPTERQENILNETARRYQTGGVPSQPEFYTKSQDNITNVGSEYAKVTDPSSLTKGDVLYRKDATGNYSAMYGNPQDTARANRYKAGTWNPQWNAKYGFGTTPQAPAAGEDPVPEMVSSRAAPTYSPTTIDQQILNRYQTRLGASQEAERAAEQQRLAQQGVSTGEARGIGAISDVARRSAMGEATAQMGMDSAQRAEDARRFGVQQGFQERQFQAQEERAGKEEQWRAFDVAAQYGSDEDVIKAYKDATGVDLDPAAVSEVRKYGRVKRAQDITAGEQGIEAGEINLDTMRQAYGDRAFEGISNRINSGATFDMLKREFPNLTRADYDGLREKYKSEIDLRNLEVTNFENQIGKDKFNDLVGRINSGATFEQLKAEFPDITQSQYDSIREQYSIGLQKSYVSLGETRTTAIVNAITGGANYDTVLKTLNLTPEQFTQEDYDAIVADGYRGERDWNKKVGLGQVAANALLAAGDTAGAAKVWESLGIKADFSAISDQQNRTNFTQAMGDVAAALATDPTITADNVLSNATVSRSLATAFNNQTGLNVEFGADGQPILRTRAQKNEYEQFKSWATNQVKGMKLASDPIYSVVSSISDDTLMDLFRANSGRNDTYLQNRWSFAGQKGIAGMRLAMTSLYASGGMKTDSEGNWTPNLDNPVYQTIFGSGDGGTTTDGTTPEPSYTGRYATPIFQNSEVGESFDTEYGTSYVRIANNGSDSDFAKVDFNLGPTANKIGGKDGKIFDSSTDKWVTISPNQIVKFDTNLPVDNEKFPDVPKGTYRYIQTNDGGYAYEDVVTGVKYKVRAGTRPPVTDKKEVSVKKGVTVSSGGKNTVNVSGQKK